MITAQIVGLMGHEPMEWDPNIPGELERMRDWFKKKLKDGFRAFAFSGDGPGELITKFDEEAEMIIMTSDRIKVVMPGMGG
jgi:hypothetical protein